MQLAGLKDNVVRIDQVLMLFEQMALDDFQSQSLKDKLDRVEAENSQLNA